MKDAKDETEKNIEKLIHEHLRTANLPLKDLKNLNAALKNIVENLKDSPKDFALTIDKNFWDLI